MFEAEFGDFSSPVFWMEVTKLPVNSITNCTIDVNRTGALYYTVNTLYSSLRGVCTIREFAVGQLTVSAGSLNVVDRDGQVTGRFIKSEFENLKIENFKRVKMGEAVRLKR